MSAVEWLPLMTPLVWVVVVLNALALWPVPLQAKPLPRTKLTLVLSGVALLGWLMALGATHIMHHPAARINMVQGSQLILIPALMVLAILLVIRLIQGKNLLTNFIQWFFRFLKPLLHLLKLILPTFLNIIANAYTKYADEKFNNVEEKEESEYQDKIHINYKGEYSGQDHRHKY